eukprot:SAG31_NODE_14_length_37953_cov_109.719660_9_plen_91_part_00
MSVMTIIETELPGKGKIGLEYKKRLRLFLSTFFLQILKPQVASHAKHASVEEFYGQVRSRDTLTTTYLLCCHRFCMSDYTVFLIIAHATH